MKNMKKWSTAIVSLLMLLAVATAASAQNEKGVISINPHIGGYIFESDQDINSDPMYGLDLGYNISDRWGIEGSFDYVETNTKASTSRDNVKAYIYRIGALYHFLLDEGVTPYLAAGSGAINIDIDDGDDDTDFLVNYGGGIKWLVTERLALRGDVRHVISFNDSNNNLMYAAGITYLLGKKEKAPPLPKDSDGDGVTDDKDKCPGTPAGTPVDADGCPKDSDGDGVTDDKDKCPDTPAGAPVDSSGCPLDSDGDGVYDYMDECPDTPQGIKVDAKGCPLPIKEKVLIELKVEFDFNSAIIRNVYNDHIQKVSNFLTAYPDVIAVIEGHTDSKGSEKYNLNLSQQRAENVVKHLVDYGIDPSKLRAKGFGESRPIADNATDEGRQLNRRVIAVISTIVTR